MSSGHPIHSATRGRDRQSFTLDSEESYSSSEVGQQDRQTNDLRLQQAINYVAEQGGADTPAIFIDRVIRIDEALIQEMPLKNPGGFDKRLHRRLLKLVEEVQREYKEAMQTASPLPENNDAIPENHTPAVVDALHCVNPIVPLGSSAIETQSRIQKPKVLVGRVQLQGTSGNRNSKTSADDMESERQFTYGGPSNEVENWYRNMPASLPFPETLQMEHCESLKINFDLSEHGKKLKAEGKVVKPNSPLNNPALEQYKNLNHLESGSKFKLPSIDQQDYDRIKLFGSRYRLKKAVDTFNKGDREEELKKNYVPRLLLNQFEVGLQVSPDAIRHAINVTPTKPAKFRGAPTIPTLTPGTGTSTASKTLTRPSSSMRVFEKTLQESLRNSPRRETATQPAAEPLSVKKSSVLSFSPAITKPSRVRIRKDSLAAILEESRAGPFTTQPSAKRKRSLSTHTHNPAGKRQKNMGFEDIFPVKTAARSSAGRTPRKAKFTGQITSDDESVVEMAVTRKAAAAAAAAGKQVKVTEPVSEDDSHIVVEVPEKRLSRQKTPRRGAK